MSNEAIKITFRSKSSKKSFFVVSTNSWESFLESVSSNLDKVQLNKLRKYWIDIDGDCIEIDSESSFEMFHLKNPENKRIFIQDEFVGNNVHFRISCDNCEMEPIVGLRYKCLECDDYDLCSECGSKNVHDEHIMLRMPFDYRTFGIKCTLQNELSEKPSMERVKCYQNYMEKYSTIMNNFQYLFSKMINSYASEHVVSEYKKEVGLPLTQVQLDAFNEIKGIISNEEVETEHDEINENDKEQNPEQVKSVLEGNPTAQQQADKIKAILEEFAQNEAESSISSIPTTPTNKWEIVETEKPEILIPTSTVEENVTAVEPKILEPPPRFRENNKENVVQKTAGAKPKEVREAPRMYHTNPRINDAVNAMMGMGFSNEGAWLTQLLVSVNGDISRALDIMRPVKG